MKNILIFFALISCTASLKATPPVSLGVAMNLAGRQQMLIQRMMSDHLMQGLDVENAQVARQLGISVVQFEENLRLLQTFSPNARVRKLIDQQEIEWGRAKGLLAEPPSRERVTGLIQAQEAVLALCTQGFEAIESYALQQQSSGKISQQAWVDMMAFAGEQRHFVQRLAMLYLCMVHDPTNKLAESLFAQTLGTFRDNTGKLLTFEGNTPAVDDHLKAFIVNWGRLKRAYETPVNSDQLGNLFLLTNDMCQEMEQVMVLYAAMDL